MKRTLYYREYYKKLYKTNKDGIIEDTKPSNKGVYKDFHLFDISRMHVLVYFD